MFSTAFAEAVANAENYVYTESEAKIKAIVSSREANKTKVPVRPFTQDKPGWKNSNKLWRITLPVIVLLVVIIGSSFSVYLANRSTHANHVAKPTPTSSQNDYLADAGAWQEEPNFFFKDVQYHILSKPPADFSMALYDFGNTQFTNFSITVTTSEIRGVHNNGDYYGIVLRSSTNLKHYYLFEITPSEGGLYEFWRSDTPQYPLIYGNARSILSNFKQKNIIRIEVKGNTFTFFVNQIQLGKPLTDTSNQPIRSGAIGLSVEGENTEVAFSHLYIQKL